MRRRVLADFAAHSSTYLRAVAKVHSSPHTGVTFLGMNLLHPTRDWHRTLKSKLQTAMTLQVILEFLRKFLKNLKL